MRKEAALSIFLVVLGLAGSGQPAYSASASLEKGISLYNEGNFQQAVGFLQEALSVDFNNPVLHYYMANCFMHLKEKESAIREFRIAYAIAPDNKVGNYSKEALRCLGAPVEGTKVETKKVEPKLPPEPKRDPLMDKALGSLKQQMQSARDFEEANGYLNYDQTDRRNREMLDRTRSNIMADNTRYTRRGRAVALPMPADSDRMLESLRRLFDKEKNERRRDSAQRVNELQKSAANLESLLQDKNNKSGTKLVPAGTNLYIRNYEHLKKQEPQLDFER